MPRLAALLLVGLVCAGTTAAPLPPPPPVPPVPASSPIALSEGFAPVVERVRPAVVNVATTRTVKVPPMMYFFGGLDVPREQRQRGVGSGVIVTPDGYILTNNHVVADATEVRVSLADRRSFKARVVGTDPKTDIALLDIEAQGLPVVPFGDSTAAKVGEFALAVGNPFGLGQTVTLGIISAVGRGSMGIVDYEDFIQTDAAINPGNSGGALVNHKGELIGINTAILTQTQGNHGIGFAVPVHMARAVMQQLEKHGRVIRGYLGVAVQDVSPGIADAMKLPSFQGALIGDVTGGSPAEKAGVRRGDVIVEMDGKPIGSANALRLRVSQTAPGTQVRLGVLRDGKRTDVTTTLAELPETLARAPGEPSRDTPADLLGMRVGAHRGRGVVVLDVELGSPAHAAGIREGDVIEEVNRRAIESPAAFEKQLSRSQGRVLLLVRRGDATQYVLLEGG